LELLESDDLGNYRISGLPAGKYIVVASLNATKSITYISKYSSAGTTSNGSNSTLTIYSGSTPRQKDASSFSIALGEERRGEDIQMPLSKLHTVSGSFVSAQDGHIINSGEAQLLNADDKTFIAVAHTTHDDPRFVFYFVYEGDYILSSAMSADVEYVQVSQPHSDVVQLPQYDANAHRFYGYASQQLHVDGDMDNVILKVPEPTAEEAQMFKTIQQAEQNRNKPPM
jgi:hypothetical protein